MGPLNVTPAVFTFSNITLTVCFIWFFFLVAGLSEDSDYTSEVNYPLAQHHEANGSASQYLSVAHQYPSPQRSSEISRENSYETNDTSTDQRHWAYDYNGGYPATQVSLIFTKMCLSTKWCFLMFVFFRRKMVMIIITTSLRKCMFRRTSGRDLRKSHCITTAGQIKNLNPPGKQIAKSNPFRKTVLIVVIPSTMITNRKIAVIVL